MTDISVFVQSVMFTALTHYSLILSGPYLLSFQLHDRLVWFQGYWPKLKVGPDRPSNGNTQLHAYTLRFLCAQSWSSIRLVVVSTSVFQSLLIHQNLFDSLNIVTVT